MINISHILALKILVVLLISYAPFTMYLVTNRQNEIPICYLTFTKSYLALFTLLFLHIVYISIWYWILK